MGAVFIKFGDVFRYNEQEYVFLAGYDEVIYAAKILNLEDSNELQKQYLRYSKSGTPRTSALYCFVILSTRGFKDRIAHLGSTENNELAAIQPIGPLDEKDRKELLEMIKTDTTAIPSKLKELIDDII